MTPDTYDQIRHEIHALALDLCTVYRAGELTESDAKELARMLSAVRLYLKPQPKGTEQ